MYISGNQLLYCDVMWECFPFCVQWKASDRIRLVYTQMFSFYSQEGYSEEGGGTTQEEYLGGPNLISWDF